MEKNYNFVMININEIGYDLEDLTLLYYEKFQKIYGRSNADIIARLKEDENSRMAMIKKYSKNYQKAESVVDELKNSNFSFEAIYEDDRFIGGARLIFTDEYVLVPEFVFTEKLDEKQEAEIIVKFLQHIEDNIIHSVMYVEVPFKDEDLMNLLASNGYLWAESLDNSTIAKTFLLEKELTRTRK